ncbi:hypothetical protein [Streptomyces sp. NPDC047070]|uniref:hypothetical protein n=1 Tax=Streptomyces sp. NPDC047070 TaxID=3154923 RepID=UPI00345618C7
MTSDLPYILEWSKTGDEDQNTAYNKSLKTGRTDVTAKSEDNFVVYRSRLRASDQGVWITEKLTLQRGSAACQP